MLVRSKLLIIDFILLIVILVLMTTGCATKHVTEDGVLTTLLEPRGTFDQASLPPGWVYLFAVDHSIIQNNLKRLSPQSTVKEDTHPHHSNPPSLTHPHSEKVKVDSKVSSKVKSNIGLIDRFENQMVLPKKAALALKAVNKELKGQGFQLVVYKIDPSDLETLKNAVSNSQIFIDVSLISLNQNLKNSSYKKVVLSNGESLMMDDDGTFDMGTSYLVDHEASYHASSLVPPQAKVMRHYLSALMNKYGFKSTQYWWRYTL